MPANNGPGPNGVSDPANRSLPAGVTNSVDTGINTTNNLSVPVHQSLHLGINLKEGVSTETLRVQSHMIVYSYNVSECDASFGLIHVWCSVFGVLR